jgi:HAD superfamily hydrolase (TIGR01509 family)
MKARGAVFDLDGTLADNMALHAEAFAIFVERHGLGVFDESLRARLDGKRNRDIFPVLFGRELADGELRRYAGRRRVYRELSRGRLVALAGLDRLLDHLSARDIPVAVATSAPPENVQHTLAELGLSARFDRVVRADEVPRGKPHPDVFLAAARLLGLPAPECVAFEDAHAGVASAKAAGMTCVGLTTTFSAEALAAAGVAPDYAVADFDEFLAGPARILLG